MIWFDLDNSPHIPIFRPIFNQLKKYDEEYFITARDFAQTKELLNFWNIRHFIVGKHGGKNKIHKIFNLIHRSYQLRKIAKPYEFNLAVSHGSRTQLLCAHNLNIPAVWMLDYEYTETRLANRFASKILMPSYIPDSRLISAGFNLNKIIRYNGFKEELYLRNFQAEPDFRKKIGISEDQVLVVIRPPSMQANYHNPHSEKLLLDALKYFAMHDNTVCLIVCRTELDRKYILNHTKTLNNIKFLNKSVDGLQLLFNADIAISGGGTMNRESALLGTKTYSIFMGRTPYLDEYLEAKGQLKFIKDSSEFWSITVERNYKKEPYFNNDLSEEITGMLLNLADPGMNKYKNIYTLPANY